MLMTTYCEYCITHPEDTFNQIYYLQNLIFLSGTIVCCLMFTIVSLPGFPGMVLFRDLLYLVFNCLSIFYLIILFRFCQETIG